MNISRVILVILILLLLLPILYLSGIDPWINLLEILLLVTAWLITTTSPVEQIVSVYKYQSFLLAGVTAITAYQKARQASESDAILTSLLILLIFALPAALGALIERLLIRATLVSSAPVFKLLDSPTENEKREAMQMWRKREGASVSQAQGIALFVFLLSLAFFTSFQIIPGFAPDDSKSLAERIGLAVSLALHLVGLYNMVVKSDIISQVIGLLVMDHGLYLAVVKIVAIPVPAAFFVVSLYFYTLITVFILVFLLPQVRRLVGIDLDEIAQQSKLEG